LTNEGQKSGNDCRIEFSLNDNPISELANGKGEVIDGVKLSMPNAGAENEVPWQSGTLLVYPNPAKEILNLEFATVSDGYVSIELVNLQGITVMKLDPGLLKAGWHKEQLDIRELTPGVYFLRSNLNGELITRKAVISR
jgi:hypothetical protein